jgi:hypothetical protein
LKKVYRDFEFLKETKTTQVIYILVLSRDRVTIYGVALVIGFIEHFDTARDYTLQFTITHTHTHTHTSVHSHIFTVVAW